MLEFKECCFCIPLRTGCLILGYLNLVASIFLAIFYIIVSLLAVGVAICKEDVHIDKGSAGAAIAVTVILLPLVIILLTFSILLVVGLHKEKKIYVKIYLIFNLIFIILYAYLYIFKIATTPFDLSYVLGTLVEILLSVYFLLVIRSHWVTMRENNFNAAYSVQRSES